MTRIFAALVFFLALTIFPLAQPTSRTAYGPVVSAYLINLSEELNELEYQLQHQEISRADYTRSKQRLLIQRQYVEKYAAKGEDVIPELQILTADEIITMLGVNEIKSQDLQVGEVLAGKWQIIGIEKRSHRFFILERSQLEHPSDLRPKPNPRDIIETITVYEPDAEELRQARQPAVPETSPRRSTTTQPEAVEIPRPQIRALYLPPYTSKAREKKIEGKVVLNALFTRDGKIKDVSVAQKLGFGLDESALEAAKRLEFEPAKINGNPVDIRAYIIYTFNLTHTIATIQPISPPSTTKGGAP